MQIIKNRIQYLSKRRFWLTYFATLLALLFSQLVPTFLEGCAMNIYPEFLSLLKQPHVLIFLIASSFLLTYILFWMVDKVKKPNSQNQSLSKNRKQARP
jgi:p-aminobenzoyl-glutamate transporter AbgT